MKYNFSLKKNGFTLIELLAVIVILAIIALISTPVILNLIDDARKESFRVSSLNIFKAAELYEAKNDFKMISNDGVSVYDYLLPIENGDFTGGKIIRNADKLLELINVTNGAYCANGTKVNLIVTKGNCNTSDQTAPTNLNISIDNVTSNSFRVIATAEDLESGIKNYQYSIDGINYITVLANNYNFLNLDINKTYTIYLKVTNNNDVTSDVITKQVTTLDIQIPTYSVDKIGWQISKIVTITYPIRQGNYVYEYSIDAGESWLTVENGTSIDIKFDQNGSVIARIYDGSNYKTASSYTISQIDNENPTVTFGTNGNSSYGKTWSTTVTVNDNGVVNTSLIKYLWLSDTTVPNEASFSTIFTNGSNISTPNGANGGYYLWVLAVDTAGNKIIKGTNVFNLDNTKPVITLIGNNSVTVANGSTYNDAGATASDNIDGDITSKITKTGTVNTGTSGNYTITYNVIDNAGNAANTVTRSVIVETLENISGPGFITSKGVNGPVLSDGMIPVKWDGSKWVDTNVTDPDWYNYNLSAKKWANVRTQDGSMWVWIPRYAYQITSGYNSSTYSGYITVKFLKNTTNTTVDSTTIATTPTYSGASQTNYIKHPAFTFGSTELTGFWMAKFEASVANDNLTCANDWSKENCDKTTLIPQILPNKTAWMYISVGNAFTVARNMETNSIYGWGTTGSGIDTHMMKNIEWGAAAYLARSEYGKWQEVYLNNSNLYITGCSGNGTNVTSITGCQNSYETTAGAQASTTGNIYGIYDMAGGASEFVAAYIQGSYLSTGYGTALVNADTKYKDVYSIGATDSSQNNYLAASSKFGDAIYETSSQTSGSAWNEDDSAMSRTNSPWFIRGGGPAATKGAGIFAFVYYGDHYSYATFRPVIAVQNGL